MNEEKIKLGVSYILAGIGATGKQYARTPARAAKMYMQMLANTGKSNMEIARDYDITFAAPKTPNDIEIKDIHCFSFCEHHLALIYDMKISVKYRPKTKIIGLSKIPRIVDAVCRRPQLQEQIANDIYEILHKILKTDDIEISIEAKHSCVNARGVEKLDTVTKTHLGKGVFDTNCYNLRVDNRKNIR